MTHQGRTLFLLTLFILASLGKAFDRSNSKRLRWDDDPSQYYRTYDEEQPDNRKLTFINNMAYDLSKKNQELMWDLYLRKGYAPSLSSGYEIYQHPQISASSDGNTVGGPDNLILEVPNTSSLSLKGEPMELDDDWRTFPDVVTSRIMEQYELTKASRLAPEHDEGVEEANDIINNEIDNFTAVNSNSTTNLKEFSLEEQLVSEQSTLGVPILHLLWDKLKDYLDELLGREIQETIMTTLWSWMKSIVDYAKTRGKKSITLH